MILKYRPEIDGLRAISIISVVLYHATLSFKGVNIFEGGFIGVDIFFLISGFLITGILILNIKRDGRINFKEFFERRIRRILPALLFVILIVSIFSHIILLPIDLIELSLSALYAIFFNSNLYFYLTDLQYGTSVGLFKPLLHTWSLAVEEQFYLLFPFLLFFLKKDFNKIFTVIFLLTMLSFFYANLTSFSNFKLSFYILPSRVWEISLGSLLALIIFNGKKIYTNNFLNYISPKIGLILIILSVLLFDKNTLHPSIITLVPLIGVILIILFSNKDEVIIKILSSKLFVFIGKISFSLYLWHFPIFAFARHTEFISNSFFSEFILAFIVVSISIFSYYFIEQPFRNKKTSFKKTLYFIIISTFTIIFVNSLTILNNGYENRLPNILKKSLNADEKPWNILKDENGAICHDKKQGCKFNEKYSRKIFLIGDSHLASISSELIESLKKNELNINIFTHGGCGLFLDFYNYQKVKNKKIDCRKTKLGELENEINGAISSIIVIFFNYPSYLENSSFAINQPNFEIKNDLVKLIPKSENINFEKSFKKTINKFLTNENKIIIVYPVPEIGENVPRKLKNYFSKNLLSIDQSVKLPENYLTVPYNIYKKRTQSTHKLLDSVQSENIFRIYPHKIFCSKDLTLCKSHSKDEIYYSDEDHLSLIGGEKLNKIILNTINQLMKK